MSKVFRCDRCSQIFDKYTGFKKFCLTCGVFTDILNFSHLFKCEKFEVCPQCLFGFNQLELSLKSYCCDKRKLLYNKRVKNI